LFDFVKSPRRRPFLFERSRRHSIINFEQVTQIVSILINRSWFYSLSHRSNNAPYQTKYLRNTTMKSIKTFAVVTVLSLISFGAFAQSVSATASTLDRAEAKIAAQAAEQGASYKITSAQFNNRVHMTAELSK
jgi:hypothetical protein